MLKDHDLSVAELAACLELAQPRVSTHLARLKDAGWVQDRRAGVSAFYSRVAHSPEAGLLERLTLALDDHVLQADALRRDAVLAARARAAGWADQVAGDMEKHYSPGRTWEALTHALLPLVQLGDVLDLASGDGAVADLLASRCRSLTCVDLSARVVAAATLRLARLRHVRCLQADMHQLPLAAESFDQVLLLQAMPFAQAPEQVLAETARVLRPGGLALGTFLLPHEHATLTESYGHRNQGIALETLSAAAQRCGLAITEIREACSERRAPQFRIGSFVLRRPA